MIMGIDHYSWMEEKTSLEESEGTGNILILKSS